jgi:hypothetical protein
MKFVISRYNENVEWADGLDNCLIYNKGTTEFKTRHPVIPLPNVGKEGHTYLHHIIMNYNNLDDYTVFLQGCPFDHTPYLEHIINDINTKIYQDNTSFLYCIISKDIFTISFDKGQFSHHLTKEVYPKVFGKKKEDHEFIFGAGAQFIVSKQAILSRTKEFYKNILKLLDYDVNPVEGYVIERFWHMIFTHTE